ncbi:MAG: radical SAM family heme chaperone HemW [Chitinivibrionales bacterium]|nr:radical SAM family heme chaperone HemW [Chitinivibrionales bacterium]
MLVIRIYPKIVAGTARHIPICWVLFYFLSMNSSYSLYIHIPFCAQKCFYCDFYSVPGHSSLADQYIGALAEEWENTKEIYALDEATVSTVYFGGGTPSLLSPDQWKYLDKMLIRKLPLEADAELTLECNPDSFSNEKARLWMDMGFNRISIGVQSAIDKELAVLGRLHTTRQVNALLDNIILDLFNSVNIDLMYGIPGQTPDSLEKTLSTFLPAGCINHVSAYELTLYENTPLWNKRTRLPFPDEDFIIEMTSLINETCTKWGYNRYEISNYAKKGGRCRHNMAYWEHAPYIGLGASAHSYIHPVRTANSYSLDSYTSDVTQHGMPGKNREMLNTQTLAREMIFLCLRTRSGLCENRYYAQSGQPFCNETRTPVLEQLLESGHIVKDKSRWVLTDKGMLIADDIARKLWQV